MVWCFWCPISACLNVKWETTPPEGSQQPINFARTRDRLRRLCTDGTVLNRLTQEWNQAFLRANQVIKVTTVKNERDLSTFVLACNLEFWKGTIKRSKRKRLPLASIGACRAVWVPGQDLATPHLMRNCGKRILSLHSLYAIRTSVHA